MYVFKSRHRFHHDDANRRPNQYQRQYLCLGATSHRGFFFTFFNNFYGLSNRFRSIADFNIDDNIRLAFFFWNDIHIVRNSGNIRIEDCNLTIVRNPSWRMDTDNAIASHGDFFGYMTTSVFSRRDSGEPKRRRLSSLSLMPYTQDPSFATRKLPTRTCVAVSYAFRL